MPEMSNQKQVRMIFLLIVAAIGLIAFISYVLEWEDTFCVSWICMWVCVAVFALVWPAAYYHGLTYIEEHKSIRRTVEMRSSGLEDAALKHEVIDANKKLAAMQFEESLWITNWVIPEKVADLEPIQLKAEK